MHARARLGRAVETAVADLYRREGFEVDTNFRAGRIEIDVIASRPGVVVFVEVKARTSDRFGMPAEAVTPVKQGRIRRAAAAWLAATKPGRVEIRFDVVSAIVRRGGVELTRIPDAF
jgi:putative endonuclease